MRNASRHTTFLLLILALGTTVSQAQSLVRGMVHDSETGYPVPLANVVVAGLEGGTATANDGSFRLPVPAGRHTIIISAIGYERVEKPVDTRNGDVSLHINLVPTILLHQEVLVEGAATKLSDPSADNSLQTTEDLMKQIPGVDFIERANFAWEPVIRGMSGGQVGLVIDGVKVIGACVDKMDPTSAYVEVENLKKLELTKGGFDLSKSSQIGGTVNLVTEKPSFDKPFSMSAETGFESASMQRRVRTVVNGSRGNTSVRASLSYRKADDFMPGNGVRITNSGFAKNNTKFDVTQRLGAGHRLSASVLADNAWGVGYPVLLMDATLAKARIYSLSHSWLRQSGAGLLQSSETRLYTNTVDHWMDDYARDVDQRTVMRSMNMPMYGYTRTSGVISETAMRHGKHQMSVTLDAYQTKSFGDMWMFSTLPNIPDMYLLNLGDILVQNAAVSAEYRVPVNARLKARGSVRLDFSHRDVQNETMQSILEGRWGVADLNRNYVVPGISGALEYALGSATGIRLSVADVARLPTHVESYGHYIYNYTDGYFYSGNPDIRPERSLQVELGFERTTEVYGVRASAFANRISNYILGSSDAGLIADAGTYRFRVFDNISAATLIGFEVSGAMQLVPAVDLRGAISYTRGQNLEFDEPLPLIPPLSTKLAVAYTGDRFAAEIESRAAMPQNRVARRAADEDGTDGYFVLNLRGSYTFNDRVAFTAGVSNVFNVYYHEHLSFGNLPALGRNVFGTLSVSI
ncbi:MAG: TonB-dependent receptor [Rhodothermales bacterium]